jgi:sigma-B regulation protein RsbU (phosphoserine phosphatase)
MAPGDLLCVYSDGITEALDAADEEFGIDRLSGLLGPETPARTCDAVFEAVSAFAGETPQYDDQTLLLVRRSAVSREP